MEKVLAASRNPAKVKYVPFWIDIPQDKDGSKRADQCSVEQIKVYTDGSAKNGQ
jgi:hypothetical protein